MEDSFALTECAKHTEATDPKYGETRRDAGATA